MIWRSGYIIGALVLSAILITATTHYNYTLGSSGVMIDIFGLSITNAHVMGALGFAFAMLLITSFIGVWYWSQTDKIATVCCLIVFAGASLFDIHSLRGYVETNITQTQTPIRNLQLKKQQLETNLVIARDRLKSLHSVTIEGTHWRAVKAREEHDRKIDAQQKRVDELTKTINSIETADIVHPLDHSAWLLAFLLWGIHTVLWKGVTGTPPKHRERRPVYDADALYTQQDAVHAESTPDLHKVNKNNVVNIHPIVHPDIGPKHEKSAPGEHLYTPVKDRVYNADALYTQCAQDLHRVHAESTQGGSRPESPKTMTDFIRIHLCEPVKASDLYMRYCSSNCAEAHSLQSFGKELAALGVNKRRSREGVQYLPFEDGELYAKIA